MASCWLLDEDKIEAISEENLDHYKTRDRRRIRLRCVLRRRSVPAAR
jgi:hypothetical protein